MGIEYMNQLKKYHFFPEKAVFSPLSVSFPVFPLPSSLPLSLLLALSLSQRIPTKELAPNVPELQ